ncbi:hypothetical protein SNE40_009911 [Patella caerulea]|uniref:Uncharacterized protein n=1 Tax=Patella caerulea TaxID=87958 RepID=A0AAN8JTF2_PATCE
MNKPIYIIQSLIVLSGMLLICQATENHLLRIALLDVKNDWSSNDTSSQWSYDITGRSGQIFSVIQWNEISTKTKNMQEVKSIFDESHDLWLFTAGLCEEYFFLDTIIPWNFTYSCVAPFTKPDFSMMVVPCSNSQRRNGRAVGDENGLFCLYRQDSLKKIKTMEAIVQDLKWDNFILIYETKTELNVKTFTDIIGGDQITLTLYNIDELKNNTEKYFNLFYKIYNGTEYESRNLLLMCSQICINTVLHQVDKFDERNSGATAMGVFSKWLITDLDETTTLPNGCQLKMDNIAVVNFPFSNKDSLSRFRTVFVNSIKTSISNFIDIELASLDSTTDTDTDTLPALVHDLLIKDLTTYTDCWRAEIFTLLYKTEGRLLSPVGHVNYTENVNLFPNVIIFPNTKYGFNQRVFRTTTNSWQPFSKRLPKVNGTVQYEGYSYDIMKVLQNSLNFSLTIIEPEDGEWGRVLNGSWTGNVGQLHRREVDLFVGPLAMSADREQAIDFVYPYFLAYTAVVFRLPDPNKNKWRKLIEPFQWEVHVCLFSSFCGTILLLYTIESLNPFYLKSKKPRPTFQGIVLYLFGAMLFQGGNVMPSSSSGRALLAAWWIFCLISVATYSGNLIAFLTVSKEKLPFETLAELGKQDEYKWGTLEGSVWVSLLQNSNLSDYKRLWQGILEFNKTDPDVLHLDQDLQRHKVITENYGYIADKTTAETWVFQSCDLTYLKELFFPMNYAFGLQSNSPYLQYFSDEMMKIMESGLAQILKRNWWPKPGTCVDDSNAVQTVELIDIQSAFYVILIGMTLACLTILVESFFTKNGPHIYLRFEGLRKLISRH